MPRLNVKELISDPDFCQNFSVTRRSGSWNNYGKFIPTNTTFETFGIIDPQDTSETDLSNPDGTLIQGRIKVYTYSKLYLTVLSTSGTEQYISDEVTWQGNQYIVILDNNYSDYGYYSYVCQLKDSAGGFTN